MPTLSITIQSYFSWSSILFFFPWCNINIWFKPIGVFLLYIVESYLWQKIQSCQHSFFDNISAIWNLNYPLASAVLLCLTLWKEKRLLWDFSCTPSHTAHQLRITAVQEPAAFLPAHHCWSHDSLSCLGSKEILHVDWRSARNADLIIPFFLFFLNIYLFGCI